jgi:hypothetical protein
MASLVDVARLTQCITTIRGKKISDSAQQGQEKLIFFVVSGTVEVHGSGRDKESPASSTLQGAGSFWGLSCVFRELEDDGAVTAHSSNVELLTISGKALLEKVDDQTLRHLVEVAGFALERTKQRSRRTVNDSRPVSAASSATDVAALAAITRAGQTSEEDRPESAPRGSVDHSTGAINSDDGITISSTIDSQSAQDLCSQVISRAAAAVPREELARTPSGWLPLQVDERPRPSLRRVWSAAQDAAQGIAIHMDELITLLDTNELLLAQLSGESCVAILNALAAVNKNLDAAGLWRGHSSAQDARRQLEIEADLCQLTGQPMDANMGRLQLEVLLKLTSARIDHLIENSDGNQSSGGVDISVVSKHLDLESVHARITECLECAHEQLLHSGIGDLNDGSSSHIPRDQLHGQQHEQTYEHEHEHEHEHEQEQEQEHSRQDNGTGNLTTHAETQKDEQGSPRTMCFIGGKKVPFASGRWVWLSKSRTSVFPFSEEENQVIESVYSQYASRRLQEHEQEQEQEQEQEHEHEGGGSFARDDAEFDHRTVMLPDENHFIDFQQMRQIRCDSHEHYREVKRCRAGIDRFEP